MWRRHAIRSAAATDVGRVRDINQDAFVERPEVGLWVVADGLGGHSNGEVASRMVCDALADFVPDGSFDQTIDDARERVRQVNEHLVRARGALRAPAFAAAAPSWRCWRAGAVARSSGPATAASIGGEAAGWSS